MTFAETVLLITLLFVLIYGAVAGGCLIFEYFSDFIVTLKANRKTEIKNLKKEIKVYKSTLKQLNILFELQDLEIQELKQKEKKNNGK